MKSVFQHGFSLIEIMVAVAILAVIAAIAIPAYNGYISTSYKTECLNEVAAIALAQEEFFLENNEQFPSGGGTLGTPGDIENGSLGLYKTSYSTPIKLAAANCTYSVTSTTGPPTYSIVATGTNHLSAVEITRKEKP